MGVVLRTPMGLILVPTLCVGTHIAVPCACPVTCRLMTTDLAQSISTHHEMSVGGGYRPLRI